MHERGTKTLIFECDGTNYSCEHLDVPTGTVVVGGETHNIASTRKYRDNGKYYLEVKYYDRDCDVAEWDLVRELGCDTLLQKDVGSKFKNL